MTPAPPSSPPLRLGLVQFHPRKGDLRGNGERIGRLAEAESGKADLLVFPETALTGYQLEGGVEERAIPAHSLPGLLGLPVSPDAPDLVVGFYELGSDGVYNSAAYLEPREGAYGLLQVHRKTFLPTYGLFQEQRFLQAGEEIRAFDTRWGRMGLLICEELWHGLPATLHALDGAQLLLVLSASPVRDFTPGSQVSESVDRWERLAATTAAEHGVFLAVAQLVGSEGGKVLQGASVILAPDGAVLARGALLESGVVRAHLDGAAVRRTRFRSPLLSDLRERLPSLSRQLAERARGTPAVPPGGEGHDGPGGFLQGGSGAKEAVTPRPGSDGRSGRGHVPHPGDSSPLEVDLARVEAVLIRFLQDEVRLRRGFQKVVVGVSGGVDSAVSLILATRALGAENVHGYRLPYRTSSPESLEHAELVLTATGAHAHTLEISGAVDAYVQSHAPDISPLRRGNVAARIRAMILFDQSARLNAVGIGTGNKSERLLGYYTWHADDSPPINPLGDLLKSQVWALAGHLGVPRPIIEKPASADLVEGVHDADELGIDYPRADLILHWLLKGYTPGELTERGFPEEDVDRVATRLHGTHWKRHLPTTALLSSTGIGEFYLRPVDY